MRHLLLRLSGPMQAWGAHATADKRHVHNVVTRSGLTGLLGACLGIRREAPEDLLALDGSYQFAVREDGGLEPLVFTDYHIVQGVPQADGKQRKDSVQSWREYLTDAKFTLALRETAAAAYGLDALAAAVQAPRFTPCLGRRSCPLTEPLMLAMVEADTFREALGLADDLLGQEEIRCQPGAIYSDVDEGATGSLLMRDCLTGPRRFAPRRVFVHAAEQEAEA